MQSFVFNFPALAFSLCWMLYLAIDLNIRPHRYNRNVRLILLVLVATSVGTFTGSSVDALTRFRPFDYDAYLYRMDGLLGFEPSLTVARFCRRYLGLRILINECYRGLLTVITLALASQMIHCSRRSFWIAVRAFILDAYAAVVFYAICPVAGPKFLFHSFPTVSSAPPLKPLALHAAPNGMPSVHLSSALLVVYFCWGRPAVGRWLAIAFAIVTAVATLATGEHYFVDLIAAIPYTILILWLSGALRSGQAERKDRRADAGCAVEAETQVVEA